MPELTPIQEALEANFPCLAGKVVVPRPMQAFVEVPEESFRAVFDYALEKLGFDRLCTITGFDDVNSLSVLYHLSHPDGNMLNIRRRAPRDNPVITTVTDRFPGGANYERELEDLLGFEVTGLPKGPRYPLPDNFPTDIKPLRKDWKPPQPKKTAP
ncbi:MAG TPA: NADH-quinone oxidoreductase subunit C [Anaeromyxobacteraceae bacterium]|nr:NADH-quinone oxidoreductase subunit C [Anaeromyxobacteraceae bacterium]